MDVSQAIEALCDQAKAALPREVRCSLSLAEEALALAQQHPVTPHARTRASIARGCARRFAGDIDGSKSDFEEALRLCLQHGQDDLYASTLWGLGIAYKSQSAYQQALECFAQGLEWARRCGQAGLECSLLNGVANIYTILGSYTEAVTTYFQSLEIAQSRNDAVVVLIVTGNLGQLYQEIGDFEPALAYHEQALALGRAQGDDYFCISILSNKARCLLELGQIDEALAAAKDAVRGAKARGNPVRLAPTLVALAQVQQVRGRQASAYRLVGHAIGLYRQTLVRAELPPALRLLGVLADTLNKPEEALVALQEALAQTQSDGNLKEEALVHRDLAEHLERRGDVRGALQHFKQFHGLEKRSLREQMQLLLATRLRELARKVATLESRNQENAALLVALDQQVREDPLTKLYNRRFLSEWFPPEWARCQQEGRSLCVALADLDNFKRTNDHFGHKIGDLVLSTVATLLQSNSRASDVCVRYGGEELLVVMPDTAIEPGVAVCERLRLAIAQYPWEQLHPELAVTISIGLVANPASSVEQLLQRADKQLYAAKSRGKNQVAY